MTVNGFIKELVDSVNHEMAHANEPDSGWDKKREKCAKKFGSAAVETME